MQRSDKMFPTSLSPSTKNSIIVGVLGVTGLLAIMLWTANTVRKHAQVASQSLFPAALESQQATTAFQRMNGEYKDAVVMQEKASLASAARDAATVVSSLNSAGRSMELNSGRHKQIVSLMRRVSDLQMRSKVCYAAGANINNGILPREIQAEFADLARENAAVQAALEALQSDLAGDFEAELASISKLLRIQEILEAVVLVGVITALFFSTRALIDATARKREDAALRQVHRDAEILLNSVPSLLIGLDGNDRIRQWNNAATMILGWHEATILGKSLDECGVKWLTADTSARVAAHVRDPSGHHLDTIKLDKNGTIRFLGLNAIRLKTNDGSEGGSLVVGADITERMALEQQLRHAQKLESVGQLAAGIAHEINTPTQYIGDNVRFLKDAFRDLKNLLASYERLLAAAKDNTLSGDIIQEVAAAVERIDAGYLLEEVPKAIDQSLEGVTRVSQLVNAMKEFSHPGTKEKIPLDLNHAIESTITVARNEWKYVANLETEFDPSLPRISCLPGEFNQVILNLILNAAHAISDVVGKGGSEKGNIKVQTRNCQDWAEIRIEDTGSGIPEKVRARIFDPFFTTKEIGKGTGQGLAIARSVVVDKHGGTIHFETEEGKGTTFIVRLPHDGKVLAAKAVPV
ncbi:MAG: ATP-binding protein [Candidatus Sulfotelmatobacter sp.]